MISYKYVPKENWSNLLYLWSFVEYSHPIQQSTFQVSNDIIHVLFG